ncbi:MAG TPA: hypothetical protein VM049_00690 [Gaiellaceae bacterium]|nr:hypothetical protein [Gaiellaceae bacterium]
MATRLVARADASAGRLESGAICAARRDADTLQQQAIAAINAGRVPTGLQEELLGRVNALVDAISCTRAQADEGAPEEARALADWLRERSAG